MPAVRRDVEIANGGSNVWRHAVPVALRILVDEVGGVGGTACRGLFAGEWAD